MTTARLIVTNAAMPVAVTGLTLPPLHRKLLAAGEHLFREVKVTLPVEAGLRKAWAMNKRAFMERGFGWRQQNNAWYLQQWLLRLPDGSAALTDVGIERLAKLDNPGAQPVLPLVDRAPVLTLPDLPHDLASKLKGYQVDPARQIYRALSHGRDEWGYPGAVDFSEVGLGKTYMDLAAALATGRRVGVLCPTVGENGWRRAFAHFGAEPHFVSTYEAVRGGFRPHIATVDGAGKFTWKHSEDLVLIFDEAQALRHDDTLTVRCCSASIRQNIPMIVASATIALSPIEMRFAGRITGLHNGGDDWPNFLQNHGCLPTGRGGWKWDGKDHHLARINARLFPMRGARVRRQDLGDECPETIIRTLPFDVPEAAKIEEKWQQTQEMLERMAAQMSAGRIEQLRRTAHMKVWAECEMALVPYLAQRAREDISKGMSVAIFMNFNPTRIRLGGLLNSHAGFYGGVNKARRKYYENEFQADRLHLLISNIKAGGASVSLHDIRGERPRRAYICMSDDAIKIEQALGRVDRVGGKSVSEQFLCYIRGARTEQMVVRTRRKTRNLSKLNDGHKADGARF